MKRLIPISLMILCCSLPLARADSQEEARAVIRRGIQAQGGEALLSRAKAMQVKGSGFLKEARYTSSLLKQLPALYKDVTHFEGPDNRLTVIIVLNGDKCWVQTGEDKPEEDANTRAELKELAQVEDVASLVPVLKESGYALAPLGEKVVREQRVVGVRVTRAGQPDVSLYFAKLTGLLVKVEYKHKDPMSGKQALMESYLTEYQEIDALASKEQVLKAAKITTDGPALLEFLRKQTVDDARRSKAGPLIRELGNADFETREKAEKELLALGAAAVPALSEALKDADPEIASRSKDLLKRIGTATDSAVVLAALRLIAGQKPERAAETLLAYLASAPNEEVRHEVVATLAAVAMREGKRDKTLVQALSDKNPIRRAAAAAALGEQATAGKERAAVRIYLPGLKVAVKGVDYRDGKEERTWELADLKFFDHFPESAFAKPK
jgi:hypothetical protein